MSENLWPDFDAGNAARSPKTVLQEVGDGLQIKTGGLVEFYVGNVEIEDDTIELSCSLWSGALRYHFPFLRAKFAVDRFYPVTLVADKLPEVVAEDEEQLKASLAKIFNARTTIETVQKLMSLSRS